MALNQTALVLLCMACAAQNSLAQDHEVPVPPVRVVKGPAIPPALLADLQERVRMAMQRTKSYVETQPISVGNKVGSAGPWRKTWCDVRDVAIEMQWSEIAGSPVVATVVGRTSSRVVAGQPTRAAAEKVSRPAGVTTDARFALLYVRVNDTWRLTLAQFRPDAMDEGEWKDLWNEPGADQQHACVVAAIWRTL